MDRKEQKREEEQRKCGDGHGMRGLLAWMICVALILGSLYVPEYGMSVQAAESGETALEEPEVSADNVLGKENATEQNGTGDAEDCIDSGTYQNITWRIDADGKLTVEGSGEFFDSKGYGYDRAPWFRQRGEIKSAVVRVAGLQDASFMFYDCSNLTSLDVSGFDTSSVTDMSNMFGRCSNLTSLDVSGFDTSSVTNMRGMLFGCSSLTSLDVSGFDTSSVTDMSDMFRGCSSLTSLDVSGFNTSSVTYMTNMFYNCRSITQIKTFSNLQVQGLVLPVRMHDNNGNAYRYFPVGLAESIVLYVEEVAQNITWVIDADGTLTVEGTGDFSVVLGSPRAPWSSQQEEIKSAVVRVTGLQDASFMFYDCSNLTSVDLSGFDTSSVTDMRSMFNGCSSLRSLDMSGFDTSSVTDMRSMFYECESLTSLNVSGWDTSSVTDMSDMFGGCSSLTSLDMSGFDTSSVTDMRSMFDDCINLTSLDLSGWDTSSVTDMSDMFGECSSLTSLDLSGFDTSSVTDMGGMLIGCSSLTSLDLSGWDKSSVTDMSHMFGGCSSLTSLDLSNFDTSSVTDMGWMFDNCSSLTSLDLSGWDTSSVTDMRLMFYECESLTSLNVSGWDTSSVTDMRWMFCNCSSLTSLDLSGFDTSNVTDMGDMLVGCSSLTSLDLSGFDTSSVTDMGGMLVGCSSLTSLDLSGFDTSSVMYMDDMFKNCSGLTSLDLSGFDTSDVTGMSYMFSNCSSLTSLDLSGFDASNVTNMENMFEGCSGLTMLYAPYNVYRTYPKLPVAKSDVWYDSNGNTYTSLPSLSHSIVLMKNTKPDAAMPSRLTVLLSKSAYEPGSAVKPEDLTVKYRGTDGRTVTLSYKGEDAESSGYTLSAVDMSTPGVKTLTVSYNDGTNTLTGSVTFTVSAPLTDVMVTLPEGEYVYNGKAHRPAPIVKAADGETLTRGKDYAVFYTNNTDAGEAVLSVTGRNAYKGTVTKNFTIRKAALENAEVTFTERCEEAQENRTQNLSDYITKQVKNSGIITYTIGEAVEHNAVAGGEGSVLSGTPSINGSGVLTYSINAGTAGDTVLIPVTVSFAKNYEDVLLNITIRLQDKVPVAISGITMANSTYNGSTVSYEGTAAVRTEGEAGEDVTELVTLSCHYTGTQADGTAYDSDTAPTHAGSYILKVTVAENDSYEGSAEYPFEIGKASLTVTATDWTLVIGEFDVLPEESALTCEITGLCGTHTAQDVLETQPSVSYGLNGEKIDKASIAIDKAGSYDLLPSGAVLNQTLGADYEITEQSYRKGTLTISESGSGEKDPTNPDDPTDPKDPTNPDDPTDPKDPTNPDDPTDPKDPMNPDDPKDPEFPDDGKFHVSTVSAQTYTGSAIKPAVMVYYGSRRLTEKTDYTVTYKNNIKANDATVEKTAPTITITGKGDYSGKQMITFVIEPKSIAKEDVTAAELFAAQSGKVQKPVPVLTWQGKKLKNKTDFTVSYPDENQPDAYQTAGTYAVTVTGTGNYTGTKNLTFTITDKTLLSKAKVTVKAKDYTVGGVTLNAEDITVKVGKDTLTYGRDYTLSYRNNTQAGKAAVIVTGTGDTYAGSKEATFQIKGESLAKAQISGIVEKTYTGAAQTQNIQVQLNGKTLKTEEDYTVSYAKDVNAGTATVIITGRGGYIGTVKKSFKIAAYDLQTNEGGRLQGIPKNLTTAYTKGGATPALTLTFDGKPLVAKKDYTITYKNNKKPASASDAKAPAMVIKGKGNFKGTLTVPFAITVSDLETDGNVTLMAPDTAYVDKAGKYMAKPVLTDANGKKLTAGTDYEKTFTYALVNADGTEKALTAADIVPEGSEVKVTVTGKGNYTKTLSATYRITKTSFAKAKITVTPQAYTGGAVTLSAKDIKVELDGRTLTYGTDYTIVPGSYRNNTKRGTATVIVKGLGDYGGMRTVKFKITAKPLAAFKLFP